MSVITVRQYEEALRDWLGDRVVFRDGWQTRTSAGGFDAHGVLHHWTAMSGRTVRPEVQERLLAAGRPDLDGPLCHLSPRRSGIVAVIAGPRANANHAGNGDADVWRHILAGTFDGNPQPRSDSIDGNERLYGFEYQFHPDDGPMPDEQVEAGILAAAALAQAHGWTPEGAAGSNLDHYEWTRRKPDRNLPGLSDRTRNGIRAALLLRANQEDDMTPQDMDKLADLVAEKMLAAEVRNVSPEGETKRVHLGTLLTNIELTGDRQNQRLAEALDRLERIEQRLGSAGK